MVLMPVSVSLQDVLDLLAGTHTGSDPTGTSTFYGVSVPDATVHARAIDTATIYYNRALGEALIVAYPTEANKAAALRAARSVLMHLRQTILGGGIAQSYSIGKLSVTRPQILEAITASLQGLLEDETSIYSMLLPSGSIDTQTDLLIVDPGIQNTAGQSVVGVDASAPWGGNGSPQA